jgi:hypothetical protein
MKPTTNSKRPIQSLLDTAMASKADIAELRERARVHLEKDLGNVTPAGSGSGLAL